MAFVATLVANPSNPVLTPDIAEKAADAVKASGLYWLADGIACDIALRDDSDADEANGRIRAVIGAAGVGLIVTLAIFVVGWAIQFLGHKFEGMKPAFFDDVKQLLIGPIFVAAEAPGR